MSFISFAQEIETFLSRVMTFEELHAKWLNTLSYLENCGARKIAACEHPTRVKEEMLKHASEEFRHAHYLKRQIEIVFPKHDLCSYSVTSLLGKRATYHYLIALDLYASRYLKDQHLSPQAIKEAAYLLVTYAIELRAGELYSIYHSLLQEKASKVRVKSIVLEEEEHLQEMQEGIEQLPQGNQHVEKICAIESALCSKWLKALNAEFSPT